MGSSSASQVPARLCFLPTHLAFPTASPTACLRASGSGSTHRSNCSAYCAASPHTVYSQIPVIKHVCMYVYVCVTTENLSLMQAAQCPTSDWALSSPRLAQL